LIIVGVIVLGLILAGLFYAFYTLVLNNDNGGEAGEITETIETTVTDSPLPVAEEATNTQSEPAPTDTATSEPATPTTIPTLPPTNTPLPTPTLRPPPKVITVGVRARVNISEGLRLNLRDQPTLNGSTVITQLVAGAEVDVLEGPEEVGDLDWWNVTGNQGQIGWIVEAFGGETYLVPVNWIEQTEPFATPEPTTTPTLTPTLPLTPTPAATLSVTPTATVPVSPTATPEGGVPSPTVGGQAEVTTQYQFINLRQEPGLAAEAIGQLADGTIVTILEGPEELDGLRWWRVEDDEGNTGWAAERVGGEVLLAPIQ
jgi:uncharacterized protein YgiM (DUF1202 family)